MSNCKLFIFIFSSPFTSSNVIRTYQAIWMFIFSWNSIYFLKFYLLWTKHLHLQDNFIFKSTTIFVCFSVVYSNLLLFSVWHKTLFHAVASKLVQLRVTNHKDISRSNVYTNSQSACINKSKKSFLQSISSKWQDYDQNISEMQCEIVLLCLSVCGCVCANLKWLREKWESQSHSLIEPFPTESRRNAEILSIVRLPSAISRDQFDMLALRWMFLWIFLFNVSAFNFLHEQRQSCGVCIWRNGENDQIFRQIRTKNVSTQVLRCSARLLTFSV